MGGRTLFFILLLLLLAAAALHAARSRERSPANTARLVLLYVLVGYCGIPMIPLSLFGLQNPERAAAFFGFHAGGAFQTFFSVAYLGMAILSVLALWYRRGNFVVGPALAWAIFFAGATFIHMKELGGAVTVHSHGQVVHVFATHGLITVLLLGSLLVSGAWKRT